MVELLCLDFLVEVVVVLRAVGVGGGCGFLDLPLVVVELGFGGLKSRKEEKKKIRW